MSRQIELMGGAWDGRLIQLPDNEPQELLMPLVDTELKLLTYQRQANGQYLIKGEQK